MVSTQHAPRDNNKINQLFLHPLFAFIFRQSANYFRVFLAQIPERMKLSFRKHRVQTLGSGKTAVHSIKNFLVCHTTLPLRTGRSRHSLPRAPAPLLPAVHMASTTQGANPQ